MNSLVLENFKGDMIAHSSTQQITYTHYDSLASAD